MALGNGRLSTQYHDSSVLRETAAQTQNDEQASETTGPTEFAYTPEERTAINQANEAFTPVIKAVDTFENVEAWVPPLIRGVRALRDRAVRETGAVNYMDHQYRKKFGDLLNAEPIGPWLLDEHRRSLLDAVHYLGSDDTCLDTFMEWLRTKVTAEQRKKWRTLRTLVDHFKRWQSGTVPNKDRRTANQKAIERIRTEGHKADAALLAEVNQARQELANGTIESMATLWTVLDHAGPEKFVQALKDHGAKDYARIAHKLLGAWLKEPTE
jgi:hypothetical protein